jgi:hypothetical protein
MTTDQGEAAELEQLTAQLREYVTPDARHVAVDDVFVTACAREALALVGQLIGANVLPAAIRTRAIIEAGSELFHKRQAPNGISQYADPAGTPMRIARDPLNVARVILAPFLPMGFA